MERLQKHLAGLGLASRRAVEEWIAAGRVTVDGEIARLGMRVDGSERIFLDGKAVAKDRAPPVRALILNKRAGVICTRKDNEGRPTCFDGLPSLRQGRWISIGRLDVSTSGLLLVSNDGEFAHRMMHPSTGLDREYAVRLDIRLSEEQESLLKSGIKIDTGETVRFSDLRFFRGGPSNYWYHLVLMEGRNRQVRRMFDAVNARVSRLKRVRFGPVILPPGLRAGQFQPLSGKDTLTLYGLLGLPRPKIWKSHELKSHRPAKKGKVSALIPYPSLAASPKQAHDQARDAGSSRRVLPDAPPPPWRTKRKQNC